MNFTWGSIRILFTEYREEERAKLPVSFQFHHVQMDGLEACVLSPAGQQHI